MNVTRANCRVQFTAEDIEFIAGCIGGHAANRESLVSLLVDEDSRDQILDDDQLFRMLLEDRNCLKVSDHFYFYVIVRHVLREAGIPDRSVADYVAEVLCEFSRQEKQACAIPGRAEPISYFFELLAALRDTDDRTEFSLRVHIGNQALFLTGMFADRIRHRARSKAFPDLGYYESVGRMNYHVAGNNRLARRHELASIFSTLSERFSETRRALNDVAGRIFSLGDNDAEVNHLLLKLAHEPSR